jgi:hypothetical protein
VASANSCDYIVDSGEMAGLQFSLTLRENLTPPVRTRNLPDSIQRHISVDTQPPSGIETIILSGMKFFFHFHSLNLKNDLYMPVFSMAVRFIESQQPLPGTNDTHGSEMLAYPTTQFPDYSFSSRYSITSHISKPSVPEECQLWSEKTIRTNFLRPGSLDNEYNTDTEETFDELQGLLDSAIRNLISPNPSHLTYKAEESRLAAKLADIAPAIFSPGYRDVRL